MNRFPYFLCLLASAHAIGALAAFPALWLGQSDRNIALAYGLGASLPLSLGTVIEASQFIDKK